MQQTDGLIKRLKSYDYKELENERLGFEYHKPHVQESTKKVNNKPESSRGVYVGEVFYSTIAEAARKLEVNYWTFKDWVTGNRNSKKKEELKLKLAKYKK